MALELLMGDLVMETFPCHLDQALDFNQTTTWMLLQMYFVDVVNADGHLDCMESRSAHSVGGPGNPPAEGLQSKNSFLREEIQS